MVPEATAQNAMGAMNTAGAGADTGAHNLRGTGGVELPLATGALRAMDAAEVALLPSSLAAYGMAVAVVEAPEASGAPGTSRVVLLAGGERREVAWIRGAEIERWLSISGLPTDELALRLAAVRTLGASGADRVVWHAVLDEPEPDDDEIELVHHVVDRCRWQLSLAPGLASPTMIDLTDLAAETVAAARASLVDAVNGAAVVTPEPYRGDIPTDWAAWFAGPFPASSSAIEIAVERVTTTLTLTPGGFLRCECSDGHVERHEIPWTFRWASPPVWTMLGWEPAPRVIAWSTFEGFEAALCAVGRHALLGLLAPDARVDWYSISEQVDDLERCLVGEVIGGWPPFADVIALTEPERIVSPEIQGATRLDRNVTPRLSLPDGPPLADGRARLLALWGEGRGVRVPVTDSTALPEALVERLRVLVESLVRPPDVLGIGLGARVSERWRAADGVDFTITYDLAAGEHVGAVEGHDTGTASSGMIHDRSGHLVAHAVLCAYCMTATCEQCVGAATGCVLCGVPVCGRCIPKPAISWHLCGACRGLGLVARRDAKKQGLVAGKKEVVLVGDDPLHRMVARRVGDAWTLEDRPEQGVGRVLEIAAGSLVARYLDNLAAVSLPS
jgi:hypothetical protein